jgi:hypothetical protein
LLHENDWPPHATQTEAIKQNKPKGTCACTCISEHLYHERVRACKPRQHNQSTTRNRKPLPRPPRQHAAHSGKPVQTSKTNRQPTNQPTNIQTNKQTNQSTNQHRSSASEPSLSSAQGNHEG